MRDGGGFQLTFDNGERGDSFIFFLLKGCIAIGKLILSKFGIERLQLFGDGIYIRLAVQRLDTKMRELQQRIGHQQLIAFLNGPGGTGKSHVVSAIVRYCKKLCENLQINFDKRTIVVTAMSGSAAVSINGETAHMACCTNKRGPIPIAEIERWKHAYLLIIDEISFASKAFLDQLNKCLGQLLQKADAKFGGIHILFVGDMLGRNPCTERLISHCGRNGSTFFWN
jgi:PIF1-like helicase